MWHGRNTHSGKKLVPCFIESNSETKGLSKTPLNRREPFKVFRHEFKSLAIRQKCESQNGCFKKAKQTFFRKFCVLCFLEGVLIY